MESHHDCLLNSRARNQAVLTIMGKRVDVLCLGLTVSVTIVTTILVAVTVMSDYWERVHFSHEMVIKAMNNSDDLHLSQVLFEGQVFVLEPSVEQYDLEVIVLAPMHGGLWTLCYELSGEMDKILSMF